MFIFLTQFAENKRMLYAFSSEIYNTKTYLTS